MSQFNTITEFNNYLSDKLKKVKLNEYFNLIQSQFYSNVNISFMDYFLELCNHENEFIVEHIKLQEYGIINTIKSSTIKQTLENTALLIENEDYQVHNVMLQSETSRGKKYAKEYKLTPYAFKLCLIRSKNSKEYAKYYLLLEQVFKNYQEYQIMYQNVLLSGKNDKIDELIRENKKQTEKIDELLNQAKETKETMDDMNDTIDDMNYTVNNMNDTMNDMNEDMNNIKDVFKETADRSVPSPKNENERHEFILLQHKELLNHYKFIRGIQKLNDSKINKKYSEYNIIKREYNANPIQLYKMFKETVKDNYKLEKQKITDNKQLKNKLKLKKEVEKIKFTGSNFELQYNYSLNNLLDDLTNICNEKFKDYNEFDESP
jgi:uncharacterized coiled-coil protein SlyX